MKYCVYCGKQLDGKDCDCQGYKAHNRTNKNGSKTNNPQNNTPNKWRKGGFPVFIVVAIVAVAIGFFLYSQKSVVGEWNGQGRSMVHDVQFGEDGTFYREGAPYGKYTFKNGVLNIDMMIAKETYYVKFLDKNNMALYTDKGQQNLFDTFARKGAIAAMPSPSAKVETAKAAPIASSTPSITNEPTRSSIAPTPATKKTWQETYLDFLNGTSDMDGYSLFDFTGSGTDNLIVYTKNNDCKIYGVDAQGNMKEYSDFQVKEIRDLLPVYRISHGSVAHLCDEKDLVKIEVPNTTDSVASNGAQDYILSNSSTAYLTKAQLVSMPKETLALARNEIYARHGFIFKTEKYNTYFSSKIWYKPDPNYTGGDETLNEFERENVKLIKQLEQ